jgi:hypothetical protein
MSFLEKEERNRQTSRTGSDNSDRFSARLVARRYVGIQQLPVLIYWETVQSGYRQALVMVATTTTLFTKPRTDSPERTGKRQFLENDLHRAAIVPGSDLMYELRDIETRRTAGLARGDAVSSMVRQ